MKKAIILSVAAVALLGACTESNRPYRHDAIKYHKGYVQDSKAHAYGRENIDSPAPWQIKQRQVPGYTDRGVVYPRNVR